MPETPGSLAAALADRYTLEKELGRGGTATVYLARDIRHDRPVALKVLHPALAATLGTDRFLREIKLVARLQHPHILPILDSGEAAGQVWFTMPAVNGESLRQRIAREGQLPLDDAVRIVSQVASALALAHRDGVVHRDVKPENILLSGDQCMLADFGIARLVDAAGAERLTETGIMVGTPAYMSPEQATADPHLDGRSDIYSLGCVLYEMLAGEPPFTGRTAQAILARSLTGQAPQLRTVRDVSEPVERVVTRALARSPADRFANASDFAAALLGAAQGTNQVEVRGRRRLVLAVGTTLALAALAILGFPRLRPAEDAALDPNLLAFLPFDALDPSLEVWREGLVDILSRTLDGAGPLRTVPPSVALRRWEGRADRASAEALGLGTGAGLVVFGAVLPKGRDSVTLRASVLDRGTAAQADIEVSGDAGRIGELADSLGIGILQTLSRSRPIGSVRHVTMGSRSLPALKAFLQGEQFYRRALWDSALTRYHQAGTADTTFALAHQRMGNVLSWTPPTAGAYPKAEEYSRRATRWNRGLSPKDSLLLAVDSLWIAAEDAAEPSAHIALRFRAVALLEEAARRFPGDPEVWYWLGEGHFHHRPVRPTARSMFERAVTLDPGFGPAYEHLPVLAIRDGHGDLARQYAIKYSSLSPSSSSAAAARLLAQVLSPDPSDSLTTRRMIDSASVSTLYELGVSTLPFWPDSAETAVRLLRRMAEPTRAAGGSAAWVLDSLMWTQYLSGILSLRGHLREAYETNRLLLHDPGASPFSWFLDPFLELSLLGLVPDSVARIAFARALEPGAGWGGPLEIPRHLRGLPWWLARRDTTSLARFAVRAAEAARPAATPRVALRPRLLGSIADAYLSLARGDSAAALRRMEAIPDTWCIADEFAANCFHLRLAQTRLLAARGRDQGAADLLEVWRWGGGGPSFVLATLERGRLAERLGHREKAIDSYRYVAAIWRRADPQLQPFVAEARAALVRLAKR